MASLDCILMTDTVHIGFRLPAHLWQSSSSVRQELRTLAEGVADHAVSHTRR
jgi:hypothetical protein